MSKSAKRIFCVLILISPVLISVLLTSIGLTVTSRDDLNYFLELESRPYIIYSPDFISWAALKFFYDLIDNHFLSMRLVGLFIVSVTLFIIAPRRAGQEAWFYFLISIAPFYWNIYFNQARLGLGLAILFLVLTWGWRRFAPIFGALGHTSVVVFLFPPAIIALPFMLNLFELLDPKSFAALRFAAYRDAEYLLMPWYFGWELIVLAGIYASDKNNVKAVGVIVYAVAVRMLADLLSVDVARRLLEVGLIAYSPIVEYLLSGKQASKSILLFYVALGAIAVYATFAGDVIVFRGAM